MTDYPLVGLVRIATRLFKFCPNHVFGVGETRHMTCRVLIDTEVY